MERKILILGGTAEARQLAGRLARRVGLDVTLSLAGRTVAPVEQGVPVRVGGFGGAAGLATYLRENGVALLIDATHPYAARISANAVEASDEAGVPLLALRRPAWQAVAGDRWIEADSVAEAVALIGQEPRRVFAALGRQEVAPLERAKQHFYLVRSVDPIDPPLALLCADYILGRGPFDEAAERALLLADRIDAVLCKNSGGDASYGKIAAARALGLPVFMVRRPELPAARTAETVEAAELAVAHLLPPAEKRGE
ncbi:MAG TPA: cobalt-precorrin-6A reductase [Mesorhizobium sp.]|nr:cobalt-precorrin-6A reductase [Mesorhizobium sp.]